MKGSKEVFAMNYRKAVLDKEATSIKLRSFRINANLTYEGLAALLQLNTPRVIYDWECAKKMPNIVNLYNLALIFNMKMEDLLVMR